MAEGSKMISSRRQLVRICLLQITLVGLRLRAHEIIKPKNLFVRFVPYYRVGCIYCFYYAKNALCTFVGGVITNNNRQFCMQ